MDSPASTGIDLSRMDQLSEAQCPDDDWTGLGDRMERKKRQTRLAVRAHRRRKALAARGEDAQCSQTSTSASQLQVGPSKRRREAKPKGQDGSLRVIEWKPKAERKQPPCWDTPAALVSVNGGCVIPPGMIEIVARLSHPSPSRPLPVSVRDLLPIVQFNLLRAALTNAITLSLHHLVGNCTTLLSRIELFPAPDQVPATLYPTSLQDEITHDDCIDIIPSSTMRNNAIRYSSKFSQTTFIRDIMGRDVTTSGEPMLIAWTDPWDPNGWEVTELFLERYGFLVEGCTDIMIATNRWRSLRGEEPIAWEVT